jgi:hypothetical protein
MHTISKEKLQRSALLETSGQPDVAGNRNHMRRFMYALKSPETRRQYPRRLKVFLDFLGTGCASLDEQALLLLDKVAKDPRWFEDRFMDFIGFQLARVSSGEISESTIPNYYKATKLFLEMNDASTSANWKKISRGLPKGRQAANDRAPTKEEIQKLVEYPDRRIKPIVYTMISSGIRIGAWDYLRWKDVEPFEDENGQVLAARLTVYAGDPEEYYSFVTPEAYHAIKDWIEFRASYGERIERDSWLMRDIWQTTNIDYGAKLGLATHPKKLKSSGIKRIIERALWEQGIRQPLKKGEKRHEWKAAHGFRKFYKSHAEQVMRPINVEITMGHDIGVSSSYYRPQEKEVLADYLNAVDVLTISNDGMALKKQVAELQQQSKDNEYIMKGKMQDREGEMKALSDQVNLMQSQMQTMLSIISSTVGTDEGKQEIARRLIEHGVYKSRNHHHREE